MGFTSYKSRAIEKQEKIIESRNQFASFLERYPAEAGKENLALLKCNLLYSYYDNRLNNKPELNQILNKVLDALNNKPHLAISEEDISTLFNENPRIRRYLMLFKDECSEDLQEKIFAYELQICIDDVGKASKKAALKDFQSQVTPKTLTPKAAINSFFSLEPIYYDGRTKRFLDHFKAQWNPPESSSVAQTTNTTVSALAINTQILAPLLTSLTNEKKACNVLIQNQAALKEAKEVQIADLKEAKEVQEEIAQSFCNQGATTMGMITIVPATANTPKDIKTLEQEIAQLLISIESLKILVAKLTTTIGYVRRQSTAMIPCLSPAETQYLLSVNLELPEIELGLNMKQYLINHFSYITYQQQSAFMALAKYKYDKDNSFGSKISAKISFWSSNDPYKNFSTSKADAFKFFEQYMMDLTDISPLLTKKMINIQGYYVESEITAFIKALTTGELGKIRPVYLNFDLMGQNCPIFKQIFEEYNAIEARADKENRLVTQHY